MPSLRQREQALRAELQSIADQANDRAALLRLAETLTAFLARLHSAADTLDVAERQRIVRLVVKDVLVGDDNIVIRHCIPAMSTLPPDNGPPAPIQPKGRTDSESCAWPKITFTDEVTLYWNGEEMRAFLRYTPCATSSPARN